MPIYDYVCHHCGHRFEVIHGVHADGPTTCPACGGGPVRKAFAPPAIHFKGSGWAKKDRSSAARKRDTATEAKPGEAGDGAAAATATPDGPKDATEAKPPAAPAPKSSDATGSSSTKSSTSAGGAD